MAETWLGNIQRAVADALDRLIREAESNNPAYCLRCGVPHAGECLRGDR